MCNKNSCETNSKQRLIGRSATGSNRCHSDAFRNITDPMTSRAPSSLGRKLSAWKLPRGARACYRSDGVSVRAPFQFQMSRSPRNNNIWTFSKDPEANGAETAAATAATKFQALFVFSWAMAEARREWHNSGMWRHNWCYPATKDVRRPPPPRAAPVVPCVKMKLAAWRKWRSHKRSEQNWGRASDHACLTWDMPPGRDRERECYPRHDFPVFVRRNPHTKIRCARQLAINED